MAKHYTYSTGIVYRNTLLNAVTADDAEPDGIQIAGAKAVLLAFIGASLANRTAAITLEVSHDGETTWEPYTMMISNTANTNAQNYVRVASVSVTGDGATYLWMDPNTLGSITHVRAPINVTDAADPAGTFTVDATVTY